MEDFVIIDPSDPNYKAPIHVTLLNRLTWPALISLVAISGLAVCAFLIQDFALGVTRVGLLIQLFFLCLFFVSVMAAARRTRER